MKYFKTITYIVTICALLSIGVNIYQGNEINSILWPINSDEQAE